MKNNDPKGLRPEYFKKDLGRGVRGKYYESYSSGTNLVLLDPEVAAVFHDEKSVNEALRSLLKLVKKIPKVTS